MAWRGWTFHRLGHARVAGPLLLLAGCALDLPTLPDAPLGMSAATTTDATTTRGDAGDEGSSDGATASADASEASTSDDAGPSPGGISAATEDAESSEDDGGSTGGSTGVGAASTGEPEPWYAGHYEGTWDGDCPNPIPISGNGTWSVDIDADGSIEGTYDGDFSGDIVGWVDRQGNTEATATGPELGECSWDGTIEANGDAQGTLDCPLDCSGQWST